MEFTYGQREEFQRLFVLRRRRQLILAVILVPAIVVALVLRDRGDVALLGLPPSLWGPAFFVLFVSALLFSLWNWRCPDCDRYLGKSISPRYCPKCGVALHSGI